MDLLTKAIQSVVILMQVRAGLLYILMMELKIRKNMYLYYSRLH